MMMSLLDIPYVSAKKDPAEILRVLKESGTLILTGLLSPEQVAETNKELDRPMERLSAGSQHDVEHIQAFHGSNTKRLTNVVTHSKMFRHEILENELVHQLSEKTFHRESGTYWLAAAQAIQIGPGSKAQPLHRDQSQYPVFNLLGQKAPEAMLTFLIALTDFTEDNGATRVILGSHHWEDYSDLGSSEMTVPAWMSPGDAILLSGKMVHGGGANKTAGESRRGIAFTLQCSYLTPEEANPFIIDMDIIRNLTPRAQRMLGFRSQYPKHSPGLWQADHCEIAPLLGLSDDPAFEAVKKTVNP